MTIDKSKMVEYLEECHSCNDSVTYFKQHVLNKINSGEFDCEERFPNVKKTIISDFER
jgi:hypothetical protein